ncbi:MAG: magnesium transporter [Candidatus Aenigmatarchaeota archaeon]|nr:MAG: magnesium transporter [Candidatus Aenigmarchaeota archaeon]
MINRKEVIEESLPILSIAAAISILSGVFLGKNEELLRALPGILIIVPSFMSVNGNISSVVSSRLSSALHMGLVKPHFRRSKVLGQTIHSMLIVSVIAFLVLGIAAAAVNILFGAETGTFMIFPIITLTAGLITVLILMFGSIFTSYLVYRHGIDPDNVVVPILTTAGDFVGITMLLLITAVVI